MVNSTKIIPNSIYMHFYAVSFSYNLDFVSLYSSATLGTNYHINYIIVIINKASTNSRRKQSKEITIKLVSYIS